MVTYEYLILLWPTLGLGLSLHLMPRKWMLYADTAMVAVLVIGMVCGPLAIFLGLVRDE